MSGGAKLASGYIELTVKAGDAMKEITASITGLGKDAEKAGKQVGDALNKGISGGAKSAGKTISDEVTSAATKAGSDAGTAINQGVTKGAKDAGKAVGDELTKATKKAGSDAGDAITKGVSKGAKDAGKAVGDEITKATQKAGADAGKVKIEPKVTPKIDTSATKAIDDLLVKGADAAGKKVGQVLGTAVHDAIGVDLGGIGDRIKGVADNLGVDIGSVLANTLDRGLKNSANDLVSGLGTKLGAKLGTVIKGQVGDLTGLNLDEVAGKVKDISGIVNSFRGGDTRGAAGGAVNLLGGLGLPGSDTVKNALDAYDQTKSSIGDLQQLIAGFGAGGGAAALGGFAAPAAAAAAGGYALLGPGGISDRIGTGLFNAGVGHVPALDFPSAVGYQVPNGPQQPIVSPFNQPAMDTKGIPSFAPLDMPDNPNNPTGRTGINYAGVPRNVTGGASVSAQVADVSAASAVVTAGSVSLGGSISLPSSLASSASAATSPVGTGGGGPHPMVATPRGVVPVNPIDILSPMSTPKKHAKGGVAGQDSSGRLFGPGTGTSDSILGVGADGVPTARVSAGEGIVKHSAMQSGGDKVVSALNAGWLPGFDDGGVIPPAPPTPQIEVPPATTGPAGGFNDWISQQQGKQYQYGTMYDCSGFMSQVYNQMTGKQMPRFNTESDLASYGFVRGSQAGAFQLGIHHGGGGMNSHMAGTLPDGRNVESGGSGVQVGAGAHGSSDPQFEDHWFLPGSGGPGGGGMPPGVAAPGDPAGLGAVGGPAGIAQRTQGYIPAGAGGGGAAGSSLFSGILQNGAQAINGIIDQAASAASSAAGMAASAFAPGSGGAASGAAASAIGLGTGVAKRGVSYGFQMAGIGADALTEIFSPFGVSRFFQTDPSQFMPHLGTQPTAVTTGEKAKTQGAQQAAGQAPNPALNPGGPVQPGQLPGAQPIAAPAPMAGATGIQSAPVPIGAPPGGAAPAPPGAAPDSASPAVPNPVSPIAPPTPQSGPQAGQKPPPDQQSDYFNSILGNIGGLARGGVVGVFDDGGLLMPGGVAINQTKRPEPVFNSDQWATLQTALGSQQVAAPDPSASGGNDYSVQFHGTVVKDVDELMAKADSQKRLNMMRHAGRP